MMKVFLLVLVFIFMSCEREKTSELGVTDESLSSFILRNYEGSQLKWKLTAGDAKVSDTTVIHKLELEFFQDNAQLSSRLEADSGYVFNKTSDLKAMGHIVVRSSDSVTLWADELSWSDERQKIFTDGEVRYSKGDQMYRGRGLESDPNLKNIVIKEKFSGRVEFE